MCSSCCRYRGSYVSVHLLLNLLKELRKRDKNVRLAEHFMAFSQHAL